MKNELKNQLRLLDEQRHKLQKDIMTIDILMKSVEHVDKYLTSPYKYDCKIIFFSKNDCKGAEIYIPVELSIDILTSIKFSIEQLRLEEA